MIAKIKNDFPASIVVFLVALPLCLGVALASGAPLLSGIIAGVIGGIVVGIISQSHTSVSGPAAGLAAVVLSTISQLGSFEVFLLAVVIAGLLQIIAGVVKGGFVANYIPSNVIKGLLVAIGLILILKQIPHAIGFDRDPLADLSFHQQDGENTFSELFNIVDYVSWGATIIALISLSILIFWDKMPFKKSKFFPPSLVVVIVGILINALFNQYLPELAIADKHLVNIPSFDGLTSMLVTPAFESITNYNVWIAAFVIAVIASLETLLNLEAVENLDPHKRQASPNRELIAQGVGNLLSGLIGGIPITSVIVRSSVNINAGAESKASTIIHGVLLLISIVVLSSVLNLIPLAALAAILLMTGYKLAKISMFKEMYKKGFNQFIPFMVTVLAILLSDLLIGVVIGSLVSTFFLFRSNFKNPFIQRKETLHLDETLRIELPTQVSFLNKASIKDTLWSIPQNSRVIIDARNSRYIDNDVMEIIEDFKNIVSVERGVKLNILGMKNNYQMNDYIQFVNVLDKDTQQALKPEAVLEILKAGNQRFVSGDLSEKYLKHQVNATSFGQNPFAIILSCIDSRTSAEHIFDLGIGDTFSIRIAGNVVNKDILGSIEYATFVGVKLIVVLGHSNCGAVAGACNELQMGNLTSLLEKVKPAILNEKTETVNRTGENFSFVNKVAKENIQVTIQRIRTESEIVAQLEQDGKVKIVGGYHDLSTGIVSFF